MVEKPDPVGIYPEDDANSRVIMAQIRKRNIKDEAAIRALVESYEFSSPEAKEHTFDSMINLLRMNAFTSPPPKTTKMDMIDTDSC